MTHSPQIQPLKAAVDLGNLIFMLLHTDHCYNIWFFVSTFLWDVVCDHLFYLNRLSEISFKKFLVSYGFQMCIVGFQCYIWPLQALVWCSLICFTWSSYVFAFNFTWSNKFTVTILIEETCGMLYCSTIYLRWSWLTYKKTKYLSKPTKQEVK